MHSDDTNSLNQIFAEVPAALESLLKGAPQPSAEILPIIQETGVLLRLVPLIRKNSQNRDLVVNMTLTLFCLSLFDSRVAEECFNANIDNLLVQLLQQCENYFAARSSAEGLEDAASFLEDLYSIIGNMVISSELMSNSFAKKGILQISGNLLGFLNKEGLPFDDALAETIFWVIQLIVDKSSPEYVF